MILNTFHFESLASPTQFNLHHSLLAAGCQAVASAIQADFSDANLTLNEADTLHLEYKHLLAALTQQHCPEVMPHTYFIDELNYRNVVDHLKDGELHSLWILKPSMLNNGTGIRLFASREGIGQHFQSSHRYDGPHVLQKYIANPHLLNGHKYTFRMFVVITNWAGAYLFRHGYFNVGREPYQSSNIQHLQSHLTNEHLTPNQQTPNVWQIPTARCPNFALIYKKMQQIVTQTLSALCQEAPHLANSSPPIQAFSIFGYDFILDDTLRLWLLEVNHGPCFPKTEPHLLKKHLYNEFWQEVVATFVRPIMEKKAVSPSELFDIVFMRGQLL